MKRFLPSITILIVTALFLSPASADILHLKNKRTVEGKIVERKTGSVILKVPGGTIEFSEKEIERIESNILPEEKLLSPKEIYDVRLLSIDPKDPEAYFVLGIYCIEHDLFPEAKESFEQAAALEKSYKEKTSSYLTIIQEQADWETVNEVIEHNNYGEYTQAKDRLSQLKITSPAFFEKHALSELLEVIANNLEIARYEQKLQEAIEDKEEKQGFQEFTTDNFIILAQEAQIGERVARDIEAVREQVRTKLGFSFLRNWSKKCKLYLYADRNRFLNDSGAPVWAAGWQKIFFTITKKIAGDEVILSVDVAQRRIMADANVPQLSNNILAHEIAHMIYSEFIEGKKVPLWFNEGIAVYSEMNHTLKRKQILKSFTEDKCCPVKILLEMTDYPPYQAEFYAQSASLIQYILTECPSFNFIKLSKRVRDDEDFYQAFFDVYRGYFNDPEELEEAWLTYLKR